MVFLIHIGEEKNFAHLEAYKLFFWLTQVILHICGLACGFFLIHIHGKKQSIIKNINHQKKNVKHKKFTPNLYFGTKIEIMFLWKIQFGFG